MNHLATAYLFGHDHIVVLGAVDRLSAGLRAAVIEHCVIVVHHVCGGLSLLRLLLKAISY